MLRIPVLFLVAGLASGQAGPVVTDGVITVSKEEAERVVVELNRRRDVIERMEREIDRLLRDNHDLAIKSGCV